MHDAIFEDFAVEFESTTAAHLCRHRAHVHFVDGLSDLEGLIGDVIEEFTIHIHHIHRVRLRHLVAVVHDASQTRPVCRHHIPEVGAAIFFFKGSLTGCCSARFLEFALFFTKTLCLSLFCTFFLIATFQLLQLVGAHIIVLLDQLTHLGGDLSGEDCQIVSTQMGHIFVAFHQADLFAGEGHGIVSSLIHHIEHTIVLVVGIHAVRGIDHRHLAHVILAIKSLSIQCITHEGLDLLGIDDIQIFCTQSLRHRQTGTKAHQTQTYKKQYSIFYFHHLLMFKDISAKIAKIPQTYPSSLPNFVQWAPLTFQPSLKPILNKP